MFSGCRFEVLFVYDGLEESMHLHKSIAVVRLSQVYAIRCGGPNDEGSSGHRLNGKGLSNCDAFVVQNSSWLKNERSINRVHDSFDDNQWSRYRHFLWTFHDGIVEAIAENFSVAVQVGSLQSVTLLMPLQGEQGSPMM